jgi:L,D-peptidoglycan transpeptidase YkuD (ErfK/YbiS/YcfS/YnhG family)
VTKYTTPYRDRYRSLALQSLSRASVRGRLALGHQSWPVSLGRSGRSVLKREGDGVTPAGVWRMRAVLYRPDRSMRPRTGLPVRAIRSDDGWCDDACDRNYNRRVRLPYPASAEHLWRADALYDVVVVLGYNDRPRIRGRGSAIFIHLERPDRGPTAGCVAMAPQHLRNLLARLHRRSRLLVRP